MREVLHALQREPHECLHDTTRVYLRDVYDHMIQIIEFCETYRELAHGLTETYMSSLSIRMNEVMKVLTMIATIFIPITFLAGVYGMNFQYFPELHWRWGYVSFWVHLRQRGHRDAGVVQAETLAVMAPGRVTPRATFTGRCETRRASARVPFHVRRSSR